MNKIKLLLLIVVMLFAVTIVSAADTRLNISMVETVDQNVTYGENFDLTEIQKYCTVTGILNISNPSAETVADINLTFTFTNNMLGNFTRFAGRNGSQVVGVSPGDVYHVSVVELLSGDYSAFNYTVNCSPVNPPLDISTVYSNPETGINRKVLAGHNWTITQTVTNNLAIAVPIDNINVSIHAVGVVWDGAVENFTLTNLIPSGDYANVHGNGTSSWDWWWQVNGSMLNPGGTATISYNMTAPFNVPTSNTYRAIQESLNYRINFLISNISLSTVEAVADLDFDFNKQITQPADNVQSNNVTWGVDPTVDAPFDVSYNLTTVSIWVTGDLDPTNRTTPFGSLSYNYSVNQHINRTDGWAGARWYFNYTDASTSGNPPPIVWMRPYFTIMNAYSQIINSTLTQNGNDIYLKYIYVVNGYWLQIDKNITSIDADTYRIDTLVQNIGNAWTPQDLVVTVYDFVPTEFTPYGWTDAYDSTSAVSGEGFDGDSYRWTIEPKDPFNSSLGPRTETYANRTWNVTYFVNGTGQYRVSELYIVGLDPRQVDGAGTHEGITLISAFGSSSTEVIYVAVVLFLIAINIVNFVMTRRINDKLNK